MRTDHSSLVWLRRFKEPEGQLARWLEHLEEFNFTVQFRRGRLHGNADALSRRPSCHCLVCARLDEDKLLITPAFH